MKNPIKFWALILIFGTLVQILGISLFSSISTTRWSRLAQPLAVGVTFFGIVALLWFAFRHRNKAGTIILIGLGLARRTCSRFIWSVSRSSRVCCEMPTRQDTGSRLFAYLPQP